MRILIASDWDEHAVNGVVRSIVNLRKGLEMDGHEVRFLMLSPSGDAKRVGKDYYLSSRDLGTMYPGLRIRKGLDLWIIRSLVAWKPDVVHTNSEFGSFRPAMLVARLLGVPLIHTYHTVYEDYTHYFFPSRRIGAFLARAFTRHVLAKCDAVIAPSEKTRRLLAGYGVKTRVETIPSGFDLVEFRSGDDGVRADLGIPLSSVMLLASGGEDS